jgi:protein TonB
VEVINNEITLTNSTYGKSTATSVFVHSALLVAFILMPPASPVKPAKNLVAVEIIPAPKPIPEPKQNIVPPKQETAPEKAQVPQKEAAEQPSPAPQPAALPGESGPASVALQSGTGTAVPTVTGIPPATVGSPSGKSGGGGGGSVSASRIYGPKPSYPRSAKEAGWEGTVVLRIRINTDGSVTVLAVREAGRADVGDAAAQTVSFWRYLPSRDENGILVSSVRDVRVKFDLTEAN